MRKTSIFFLAAALACVSGSASAQKARRPDAADAAARREWLKEHKDDAKARWEKLTPEQREAFKAHMKAYQDERKALMEKVKAGTIDKKTAAAELKKWREEHKPTKT